MSIFNKIINLLTSEGATITAVPGWTKSPFCAIIERQQYINCEEGKIFLSSWAAPACVVRYKIGGNGCGHFHFDSTGPSNNSILPDHEK